MGFSLEGLFNSKLIDNSTGMVHQDNQERDSYLALLGPLIAIGGLLGVMGLCDECTCSKIYGQLLWGWLQHQLLFGGIKIANTGITTKTIQDSR